jgi:signal transduction histidine kinase
LKNKIQLKDSIHDNKLKILGKLAASLSHEIRNPLSVLKLNLEFLKMNSEEYDSETNECITAAIEAANIINELTQNTLEFSRKNRDDLEFYQLNNIIKKAIQITKGSASKKNINYTLNLNPTIPELEINETKILQVIVNLLSNAIEASLPNSNITLNSFEKNDSIHLEVVDEGSGFNEFMKDEIFTEFYTNKEDGTGLGLSVCKTLLEEHNAEIIAKNNETKGATFIVKFPLFVKEEK